MLLRLNTQAEGFDNLQAEGYNIFHFRRILKFQCISVRNFLLTFKLLHLLLYIYVYVNIYIYIIINNFRLLLRFSPTNVIPNVY